MVEDFAKRCSLALFMFVEKSNFAKTKHLISGQLVARR